MRIESGAMEWDDVLMLDAFPHNGLVVEQLRYALGGGTR